MAQPQLARSDWGSLPVDLLYRVFGLLPTQGTPCTVREAFRLVAGLAVNRHWRQAAAPALRLPLRCDVRQGELHLLLLLVSRGFGVQQLWIGETAPTNALSQRLIGGVMEPCWMTSCEFWQQVAPQLQLLAGLPAGGPTWPWQLLQACPSRLHSLHLHLSDGCGTLTVGGGAWRDMEVLAELAVTAGPYTTLTLEAPLPPALRQLGAQAGNLYCDLPLLLSVPAVQLAAREVYSVANTEENNDSDVAYVWGLAELAEAVAAAGMPEGHCVELSTQGVWYRRPNGEAAWLHARFTTDQVPDEQQQQQQQPPQQQRRPPQAPATPPTHGQPQQQPLHSLLPPLPLDVVAAFAASPPRQRQPLVAVAGGVTVRQVRGQPLWPLDPRWDDPDMAAVLLSLTSSG